MAADEECMAYARECVRLGWTDRRAGNSRSAFRTGQRVDGCCDAGARRADLFPVNQWSVATGHAAGLRSAPTPW